MSLTLFSEKNLEQNRTERNGCMTIVRTENKNKHNKAVFTNLTQSCSDLKATLQNSAQNVQDRSLMPPYFQSMLPVVGQRQNYSCES